jgi:hypothetical protein
VSVLRWSWSYEFTVTFDGHDDANAHLALEIFSAACGQGLAATVRSIYALGKREGEITHGLKIVQITRLVSPHYFPNCLPDFGGEFSWTATKQESHWQHTKKACSSYRQYSYFPPALVNAEISEF